MIVISVGKDAAGMSAHIASPEDLSEGHYFADYQEYCAVNGIAAAAA